MARQNENVSEKNTKEAPRASISFAPASVEFKPLENRPVMKTPEEERREARKRNRRRGSGNGGNGGNAGNNGKSTHSHNQNSRQQNTNT